MIEEAKRRDHRKIGAEMGLFAIDTEYVGPGLPLWLPKGTAIVEELEKLAKETEFAAGYVRVKTPHIAREKMYLTSGHLPYLRGVNVSADGTCMKRAMHKTVEIRRASCSKNACSRLARSCKRCAHRTRRNNM